MTHQVLEEYSSLPTAQTTNRVPRNCWNYQYLTIKYVLMVTFENGEIFDSEFEIMAQYSTRFDSKWKKNHYTHSTVQTSLVSDCSWLLYVRYQLFFSWMTVCLTFDFSCTAVEWTIIQTGSTLNGMIVTSQSHTQRPAASTKRVTTRTEISQTQICIQRYVCTFSFRLGFDKVYECKVNLLFCWGRTFLCLLVGCNEEWRTMSQPQCGRCHRAGTGQTTLEVIGSKGSYTWKWCKLNNDDDDDDLLG